MHKFERPCFGGPCTPKGEATPGFCRCKIDADEIAKLRQVVLHESDCVEAAKEEIERLRNRVAKLEAMYVNLETD